MEDYCEYCGEPFNVQIVIDEEIRIDTGSIIEVPLCLNCRTQMNNNVQDMYENNQELI